MWFSGLLMTAIVAGCGGGGDGRDPILGIGDSAPPTITSTISANGATDVAVNAKIAAVFSEAMAPASINAANFTVKQGTTPVAGTVSYTGVTANFKPTVALAINTVYTATISSAATDLAGNQLSGNQSVFPAPGNYVWSFTTGATSDTLAPTVTSTVNPNGATGVAVNTKIGAFFSEAMDPQSVNAQSFIVMKGATQIAGTVAYSGVAVTFTPATTLDANTKYTMTIASAVTDLADNRLSGNQGAAPSNYVWSFTTGAVPNTSSPTVTLTDSLNNATDVVLNKTITANFSEAMDHLTITAANFTLKQGTTPVAGTVDYVGTTASFDPAVNLLANTLYTATISKNVTDVAGNKLAGNQGAAPSDYVWSFTTGVAADTTAPTVISTDPTAGETNVALNKTVNASFSEAMQRLTITTANFTLMQGISPIAGTVRYAGTTATFEPSANLTAGAVYTATISKNVTDVAGNKLAGNQGAAPSDFVWNFTAIAAAPLPAAGPASVNLRSAAAFAILAGAGVTSTGATIINGDLGTSPTGTIDGFPPGIVNGTIHAADPIAAQAKLDLTTAYNDAQGRSLNAISLPGNMGGLTLAPGLYVNSTSSGISGTGSLGNLTLNAGGNPNAIWIFKMGSTLTTGPGTQIILAGGAKAANIFWAVGTSATLGTTSIFKGNILADQSISANTGAVVEGRLLARIAAVTLQGNTVTLP
jgi:hypothetical protein